MSNLPPEEMTARLPSPSARLHEVTMQALTHAPRSGTNSATIGQEARTKEWYVKEVSVYMDEGEGWAPWAKRVGEIAKAVAAELPPAGRPENGGGE